MEKKLKYKIDKIVDLSVTSGWKKISSNQDLVFHIIATYFLIGKSGKKYLTSSYGAAVIHLEEQKLNYTQVEELKYHKMCNAKKALRDFIQSQLSKRNGYFKFVDIEEGKK